MPIKFFYIGSHIISCTQELVERVTENLVDWYSDFTLDELKDTVDDNDEGLFDELVDNVTNETVLDINNNGGQF